MSGKLAINIKRVILMVVFMILPFLSSVDIVYAYDVSAPHPDINKDIDINETKELLWKELRRYGFSEASTAGIMGNIGVECGFNYNRIEGGNTWENFQFGMYGLGLAQWTSAGRQQGLFATADEMGKQWIDLKVQVAYLKKELDQGNWWSYGGNYSSYDDFKNEDNFITATDVFCFGFERPGIPHLDRRHDIAREVFETYTGTDISGSDADIEAQEDASKEVVGGQTIVNEWDLVGMPGQSELTKDASNISLPDKSTLSTKEGITVATIRWDILQGRKDSLLYWIRVGVSFIGLVVIVYALLLLVAYIFDMANNVFEVSLLNIMSFGTLKISYGDYVSKGYVNGTKITKICVVSMIVGMFLLSGGIFNFMAEVIYWVNNRS